MLVMPFALMQRDVAAGEGRDGGLAPPRVSMILWGSRLADRAVHSAPAHFGAPLRRDRTCVARVGHLVRPQRDTCMPRGGTLSERVSSLSGQIVCSYSATVLGNRCVLAGWSMEANGTGLATEGGA